MVATMGRHAENPDVQEKASGALANLAQGHPENMERIKRAGVGRGQTSSWPASKVRCAPGAVVQMVHHHPRQPGATLPPPALYQSGTPMPTSDCAVQELGQLQ